MLSVLVDNPAEVAGDLELQYAPIPDEVTCELHVRLIKPAGWKPIRLAPVRKFVVPYKVRPAHVVVYKKGFPVVSVLNPLEVRFSDGRLFRLIETEAVQWAINNGVI